MIDRQRMFDAIDDVLCRKMGDRKPSAGVVDEVVDEVNALPINVTDDMVKRGYAALPWSGAISEYDIRIVLDAALGRCRQGFSIELKEHG